MLEWRWYASVSDVRWVPKLTLVARRHLVAWSSFRGDQQVVCQVGCMLHMLNEGGNVPGGIVVNVPENIPVARVVRERTDDDGAYVLGVGLLAQLL